MTAAPAARSGAPPTRNVATSLVPEIDTDVLLPRVPGASASRRRQSGPSPAREAKRPPGTGRQRQELVGEGPARAVNDFERDRLAGLGYVERERWGDLARLGEQFHGLRKPDSLASRLDQVTSGRERGQFEVPVRPCGRLDAELDVEHTPILMGGDDSDPRIRHDEGTAAEGDPPGGVDPRGQDRSGGLPRFEGKDGSRVAAGKGNQQRRSPDLPGAAMGCKGES